MSDERYRLIQGDCLAVLKTLPAGSVDAVVTDPPAGIGFMGKTWDQPKGYGFSDGANRMGEMPSDVRRYTSRNPVCRVCHGRGRGAKKCRCVVPDFDTDQNESAQIRWRCNTRRDFIAFLSAVFTEARRVIRPGGYALVWAIPRTSHWTATALEDAGWEIRDRISHLFGQGFPKGKGCLKPACEDWWLCRAPGKGVRPLGIDECRIGTNGESLSGGRVSGSVGQTSHEGWRRPWMQDAEVKAAHVERAKKRLEQAQTAGRWPANVVLSHVPPDENGEGGCRCVGTKRVKGDKREAKKGNGQFGADFMDDDWQPKSGIMTPAYGDADGLETVESWECARGPDGEFICPVALLDEQSGVLHTHGGNITPEMKQGGNGKIYGTMNGIHRQVKADTGGASRFFYTAKASRRDRGKGNSHPTVKSTALMSWLVKLVCEPGGTVLDCFAGSGSTGVAALREGRRFLGAELDPGYFAIAQQRLAAVQLPLPVEV